MSVPEIFVVADVEKRFLNMFKLLMFSLRKNGGSMRQTPVTFVTNGLALPEEERAYMAERFSPLRFRAMPRLGGNRYIGKFNAMYAIDETPCDTMVMMDCDIVILNALDGLETYLNPAQGVTFAAMPAGRSAFNRADLLLQEFAPDAAGRLAASGDERFAGGLPYFACGVYLASRPVIERVRNDVLETAYALFDARESTLRRRVRFAYNRWVAMRERSDGLVRFAPPQIGLYYNRAVIEQIALAIALWRHSVPFELLDGKYNCTSGGQANAELPPVFHYAKGLYAFPRVHLFNGDWIAEYQSSDVPCKRALAETVAGYVAADGFPR